MRNSPEPTLRIDTNAKYRELRSEKAGTIDLLLVELKAARDLETGKRIHAKAIETGSDSCIYVANSLIRMYAKCRSMADARQMFQSIENPTIVSWNTLILGYAENGQGQTALDLFAEMKSRGCPPDSFTFLAALKACISFARKDAAACLEKGKRLHSEIGSSSCSIYVQSTLVDMYCKCGSMADARRAFDAIKRPNLICWNSLILGYAENGEGVIALDLFSRMKSQGFSPESVTYIAVIKACTSLALKEDENGKTRCFEFGKQIHSEIGHHMNSYVQGTLIDMYSNCGRMTEARQVFDSNPHPDEVSWNALILGYAENGKGDLALEMYTKMRSQRSVTNTFTCVAALKACSSVALENDGNRRAECLELGRQIHLEIGKTCNIFVQNTLIDMYAKCGSMSEAHKVFDSIELPTVVSWNALICGYADTGESVTAFDLLWRMRSQTFEPNAVTYIAVLKACTLLAVEGDAQNRARCLEFGKQIHSEINCGLSISLQTTLIDMYAKLGSMVDACEVFNRIKQPDVPSWNALILGHAENGQCVTALDLFARMKSQGFSPSAVTFVVVFKACGFLGALEWGHKIHSEMNPGMERSEILVTSLVNFYAKCGSMAEAQKVFDLHPTERSLLTWNALLGGYSRLGDHSAVFALFEGMRHAGLQPNCVTFLCILTCCSHAGLAGKASEVLEAMPLCYGIAPTLEHYTCMIDVFGRSNKLQLAVALLRDMPWKPTSITWTTVLSSCDKWRNVEIGRLAFSSLDSTNEDGGAQFLMAHIYASRGMWKEHELMKSKFGTWKRTPGQSFWTNEQGQVHSFS